MAVMVLGGRTAVLCFAAAAAVVLLCGFLEASKGWNNELERDEVTTGRVELLEGKQKAGKRGRWQNLAVWDTSPDPPAPIDTPASRPRWLDLQRKDRIPGPVDRDRELRETRKLRGRLERAERELEEAQDQLKRAEGGLNGADDTVAGQRVGKFEGIAMASDKGPEIKFSKTLLSNGESVRIEWSGIKQVSSLDFIALYTSADADNHDFLEMHNVTESSTWSTGAGSIAVKLYNHRVTGGYEARYFRKGQLPNDSSLLLTDSTLGQMIYCPSRHCTQAPVYFLVTISSVAAHFPVHEPTQVRLALTGVPTEMRVMWVSEPCPGKPLGGAAVIFSDTSCKDAKADTCRYPNMAEPLYRTYSAEDMCGPPANQAGARAFIDPGYIYNAVMTGLEPSRRYFYRVGCYDAPRGWHAEHPSHATAGWGFPAGSMMSEEMSFVAAPWTQKETSVTLIAYADSGVTAQLGNAHSTMGAPERVNAAIAQEVAAGRAGMVVHMGDLSYADGRGFMWEQWGAMTQAISSAVPFMVTVGNHEYTHQASLVVALTAPGAANRVEYQARAAAFGPELTAWKGGGEALVGQVVRAEGWFFKGPTQTDDFCRRHLPDAEELVQGRLLYENRVVLVEAGNCGYARKVKVAQLFGAAGAIVFGDDDTLPHWTAMPHEPAIKAGAPEWTDEVSIPSVYIARKDGLDLLQWVDDHSAWSQEVRVVVRSSKELQLNDPSLAGAAGEAGHEAANSGYHPAWGNYGDDSRGECGVPFAQRFSMPDQFGGNGNFWYSFEYGPVRLVAISTEHDLGVGSAQRVWLEKTLADVDRSVSPWVVVMMHRSIYGRTESAKEQKVSNHLQQALEPLFRRYHVNVVLSGHEHRYLRTAPVYMDLNMATTRGGFGSTYAMVGTGGAKLQYRARDEVHNHFYCVGGVHPMRRCRACAGSGGDGTGYVCRDSERCCSFQLDDNDEGYYKHCGLCERINATGPGHWTASSRAGARDALRWGWQRKMLSDFGFLRVTASELSLRLEFVQTLDVFHTPTVDRHGRSLHLAPGVKAGCKESCANEMVPDGHVMDSLVLRRMEDGSLHAEDSEVGGLQDKWLDAGRDDAGADKDGGERGLGDAVASDYIKVRD